MLAELSTVEQANVKSAKARAIIFICISHLIILCDKDKNNNIKFLAN
jgi:hypothetical protein